MKLEKFFISFSSILIILFPFFLIKPASADIACVILGVIFLFFCIVKKNFIYFKNIYFYFFLIIFFYININSFFSFKLIVSFEVSLAYLRVILFVICLSFFFKKIIKLKLYFYYSFLICILILLLGSIFQIWSGHYPMGGITYESTRISSFFGTKLIMGSYVGRLLPLFLGIGILLNLKKMNYFILIISSILVILSAERISFIYLLMCALFYFYLTLNLKYFFNSVIFYFIIFCTFFLMFPKNYERLFIHTYNQVNESKNVLGLSYRHSLHYLTAWNMFLDKKLTGHGLKTFRYLCDDSKFTVQKNIIEDHVTVAPMEGYVTFSHITIDGTQVLQVLILNNNEIVFDKKVPDRNFFKNFVENGQWVKKDQKIFSHYEFSNGCNTHPHNIYLQFLAELGFFGFLLFLIIFLYSLYNLYIYMILKKKNLKNFEKCLALILFGIASTMFPLFPSGNYFNNWLLIISYLPFGFYLYLIKEKNV